MDASDGMETITVSPGMMIQGAPGTETQVLQVLSLKDATALTKAINAMNEGKKDDMIDN